MTQIEAQSYQYVIDDCMDTEGGRAWLEKCLSAPSQEMTHEHCEMIRETLKKARERDLI